MTNSKELKVQVEKSIAEYPPKNVDRAIDSFINLSELALAQNSSSESKEDFHFLLQRLHYEWDEKNEHYRQFLAQLAYPIWERNIEIVKIDSLVDPNELRKTMVENQENLNPLKRVPMYDYLLEKGNSDQIKLYYEARWALQHCFWKSIAEGAYRLMRQENMRIIQNTFKNVWEELGEGEPGQTHPELFGNVAQRIGIDAPMNPVPKYVETAEFLNFRMMCMRHENVGWGMGAIFSVEEACSLDYSNWHVDLLKKVGIEKKYKTVDSTHATLDVEHADEAFENISLALTTPELQSGALTSQIELTKRWLAHLNKWSTYICELEKAA